MTRVTVIRKKRINPTIQWLVDNIPCERWRTVDDSIPDAVPIKGLSGEFWKEWLSKYAYLEEAHANDPYNINLGAIFEFDVEEDAVMFKLIWGSK